MISEEINNSVALPLLLPLLGGIFCLLFRQALLRRAVAISLSALQFAVAVVLALQCFYFDRLGLLLGGWQAPFGIAFVVDGLGATMLLLSSLSLLAATFYSIAQWQGEAEHPFRLALFQFLSLGVNLSFVTGDFFNLFVAFEVMLLSSYGLTTLESAGKDIRQGFNYVLINVMGSTLFLCLAGFAYGMWGTLNFADLALKLAAEPNRFYVELFALLSALVFGLKAGVFPLYFWLPKTYPTLPFAVSGYFAGMLTKVGVYVLFRMFATVLPSNLEVVPSLMGWLSLGTMLFGVFGAMSQKTIRGVLSYHVLSQVGYMTLCFGFFSPAAAAACLVYIVHHIVVKGSLLLIGGVACDIQGTDDLSKMGGVFSVLPLLGVFFLAQAFSLAGLPPLSGFWGKYMILKETVALQEWYFAAGVLITSLFTLLSMLKIWNGAFWGQLPTSASTTEPSNTAVHPFVGQKIHSPGVRGKLWVCGGLTAVSLAIGLGVGFLQPIADKFARVALDKNGYAQHVFGLVHKVSNNTAPQGTMP
jgi:multicomponent Na+:H+ antiporter subunit D